MSTPDLTPVSPSFGAPLIGVTIASFLCGCLLLQTYIYLKSEIATKHPFFLRFLVLFILFVDTLHLVIAFCYVYGALVVHSGDASYLARGSWSFYGFTALSVVTSTPVQLFYAWRVYILGNRRLILPSLISLVSLLAFSCGIATTAFAVKTSLLENFGYFFWAADTWLGANIFVGIVIVCSLCFFLIRGRTGFKQTDQMIDKLVFVVINTGLAPTLMELGHLIAFSIAWGSFAHLAFNILVPKLYANSMLASLNARHFFMGSSRSFNVSEESSASYFDGDRNRFAMRNFRKQSTSHPNCSEGLDIRIEKQYETQYEIDSDGPSHSATAIRKVPGFVV